MLRAEVKMQFLYLKKITNIFSQRHLQSFLFFFLSAGSLPDLCFDPVTVNF